MRHRKKSHMSHVRLFAVLVVISSSSAIAQTVPAEQRGARCLAEAVQRIDDRIQPARDVAAAAVALCREPRAAALKELRPGASDAAINLALDGLRDEDIAGTTAVVLEWRRKAR